MFHVRPPLEILRNSSKPFSEAAIGGVPQKVFFKHFKIFTGKHLYWGLFLIKLQAISPVTSSKHGLKRDSKTDVSCDYHEICLIWRTFANGCIGKSFVKTFFSSESSKGNFWCKKCSPVVWMVAQINQDWKKIVSYHKVLGEEGRDLILI